MWTLFLFWYCLSHELGEIVVAVKMPLTRNGTERPREPSL